MGVEVKIGLCKWCDHDQCHIKCYVEDGRLTRAGSFPESPFQAWFGIEQCPKMGHNIIEQVYHPNRVKYPLKRAGERGGNKWQKISWEQAFDEIADKLGSLRDSYGAECLGGIFGLYNEQWDIARFFNLFGSPNLDSVDARICGGLEAWMNIVTYGGIAHYGPPDPENTKLLVLWANQAPKTNPIKWARGRDVEKLIVIDPRRTEVAVRADIWLQPRPGTDGAIGLGWLNVIINEELYDKDFVEKWTVGFEDLKKRIQEYPPEKVAEITGIPKEKIVDSARMYATVRPGYILWGSPTAYVGLNSAEIERTRCILRAVTGNLEVKGGNQIIYPFPHQVKLTELELAERLPTEQVKKALGSDRFKVMAWPGFYQFKDEARKYIRASVIRSAPVASILHAARTGEPYQIRAMFIVATNPLLTVADTKKVYEALKATELLVVQNHWLTPEGALADYVLPTTMWIEKPSFSFLEHANSLIVGQRVLPKTVDGEHDLRDDYDIFRNLGIRLGKTEDWPWETLEDCYDYRLKPLGISWEEFSSTKFWMTEPLKHKNYEKTGGFNTPTGKVELSSTVFENLGYDPLPYYEEPAESPVRTPDIAKEFPYVMISRRSKTFLHSSHRQVRGMRRMHPEPIVEIHPDTAKKHQIEDGDMVWVETKRGKIKQRARLTDIGLPDVINPDFGWWFPEKEAAEPSLFGLWESNVNVLTSLDLDHCSQSCGTYYLGCCLCKISKAEDGGARSMPDSPPWDPSKVRTVHEEAKGLPKYLSPCGYVYDPVVGDVERGIAPGTPFKKLPKGWVCPKCSAQKRFFTEGKA
jgi:anaerobic selenocysteine-containing dehydrogenase/rubredoxin